MGVGGIYGALPDLLESFSFKDLLKAKTPLELADEDSAAVVNANAGAAALSSQAVRMGAQDQALTEQERFKQSAGRNLMSGNFADADSGVSKYITAKLESFEIAHQIKNAMHSQVSTLLDAAGGLAAPSRSKDKYAYLNGGALSELEIKRLAKQEAAQKVMEAAEKDFKETRDDLEAAVEAAAAPKDAQGEPILLSSGSDSAPVPQSSVVQAAEASAEAAAEAQAAALPVQVPVAPAARIAINITV